MKGRVVYAIQAFLYIYHFYQFAGDQDRSIYIKLSSMSKRNKQSLQTRNNDRTLHHYFPNQPLSPAKPTLLQSQENTNANTNSASYPPMQPMQAFLEDDIGEDAVNYEQLRHIKNIKELQQSDLNAEEREDSRTIPQFEKIVLSHDDSITQKYTSKAHKAAQKQTEKEEVQKTNVKSKSAAALNQHCSLPAINPVIPGSKQNEKTILAVQQIFSKRPLRQRNRHLLSDYQKFRIGHQHSKLLKLLRVIDYTIDFMVMQRSKSCFFSDLTHNINKQEQYELNQHYLKQLLFLDQALFDLEWQFHEKLKRYDLQIKQPVIKSEDQRARAVKHKLIDYLFAMEIQFLNKNNAQKASPQGWSDGFDPNDYTIPQRNFPPHPNAKTAEIRNLTQEQISNIGNDRLRKYMLKVKEDNDAKSMCSEEVSNMIFCKKGNKQRIKEILDLGIKEKEKRCAQAKLQAEKINQRPPLDVLAAVCDAINQIYMGFSVSSMYKATLAVRLQKKLTYKLPMIQLAVQWMIQQTDIDFLREFANHKKELVNQISRTKYKAMLEWIKAQKQ